MPEPRPFRDQGKTDTAAYTRLHLAFAAVGRSASLDPFVARVALAMHERGNSATTFELVDDLRCDSSSVRRALLTMYRAGLATGTGSDGGARRRGVETQARLTRKGRALTARILKAANAEAGS